MLRWPNRTFLAPSDEAFAKTAHVNDAFQMALNVINVNDSSIAALFSYHTLPRVYKTAEFADGPDLVATTLVDLAYTALSGGQVFVADAASGQSTIITSGMLTKSAIVAPVSCPKLPFIE